MNALVTGAARGIGRGIALELARAGMDVAVGDVRLDPYAGERYYSLRERVSDDEESVPTAQAVEELGRRSTGVAFDVSDPRAVREAVREVESSLGAVDVLVNNAGIVNNIAPIGELGPERWQREIDVNLSGAFHCVEACVPAMAERGFGRVVNVSSIAAIIGITNQAAYAASKAGLIGLTKAVAREFGGRGVTCNAVLPGLIRTALVRSWPEDLRARMARQVHAGRIGEVSDVGALIAFLASPAAGYITAQAIAVDGGWTLGPPASIG